MTKIHETLDVMTVKGNGSSSQLLRDTGLDDSDLMVPVTDSDEINMISCMTAKGVGIPRTIARIRDPDYVRDLIISKEDLGIDLVINPDYAASQEISRLLTLNLPVHTEHFANGKVQYQRWRPPWAMWGPASGPWPMTNFFALPASAKAVLSLCMLVGRLEIYTILVILSTKFWRS